MEQDAQEDRNALFPLKREHIANQCVCCGGENLLRSPAVLMPFVAHRALGWAPVTIDASWGLSTIKSGEAYSICNSTYCLDCRLLFLDIRFSDVEMGNLYKDYRGEEYSRLRDSYEPGYALRNTGLNAGIDYVRDIERFLKPYLSLPVSILDWGGDVGKNTPFRTQSTKLDIYDISSKVPVEGARIVEHKSQLSDDYGLVVCSNVLEHVPYPSDLLFDIKETMDENSILYLELPLEDLVREKIANPHTKKRHWHEHINFYSEKSIRKLVENVGFEVIALDALSMTVPGKSGFVFQVACKIRSR